MALQWTITAPGVSTTVPDDMGENGAPTFVVGETGTYTFDLGEDDTTHETLLGLLDHAGAYETYQSTINDQVHYRDRSPGSLLVGIDAHHADGGAATAMPRVWGLLAGGSDATPPRPRHPRRIELEVLALTHRNRYATREQARAGLETTTVV